MLKKILFLTLFYILYYFSTPLEVFAIDWTISTVDSTADVGMYSAITTDAQGNYLISYYDNTNGNLKFAKSTDSGVTWTISTIEATDNVGQKSSIAVDSLGNYLIVYESSNVTTVVKVAKSSDGGLNWSITEIDGGTLDGSHTNPRLSIDNSGNYLVTYNFVYTSWDDFECFPSPMAPCNIAGIKFAKSTNGGSSWTISAVATTSMIMLFTNQDIAVDRDNNYLVLGANLYFARSVNAGSSWSINYTSPDTSGEIYNPKIMTDNNNHYIMSYYGRVSHYSYDFDGYLRFGKSTDNGTSWVISSIDSIDDIGDRNAHNSQALDDDNNYLISYYQDSTDNLKFAQSADNGSSWDLSTIDAEGDVGQYNSLTIGPDNTYLISYYDNTNHDLKLAKYTPDSTPPTLSSVSAAVSNTTATITWTTNEASSSQIEYGLTTGLGSTTTIADTNPLATSHSVEISSLLPCTLYHYRPLSVDAGSNQTLGDTATFITTGCAGTGTGSTVSSYEVSQVTNSVGGGLTLASSVSNLALTLPPLVSTTLDASATLDLQAKVLESNPILSSLSVPTDFSTTDSNTNSNQLVSDIFDLKLYTGTATTLSSFDQPITVTLSYTPSQLSNLDLHTFSVYRHDGNSWIKLASTHDFTNYSLTATTSAFSLFAIFGQTANAPAPAPVSIPQPEYCSDSLPSSTPDLFEIRATSNSGKLFFTPIGNTSTYVVSFSTSSHAQEHGETVTLFREGVQSHTIYHLIPNTTYYVKVRGQNGCMPGEWSDVMKFKTNSESASSTTSFYKWRTLLGRLLLNPTTTSF